MTSRFEKELFAKLVRVTGVILGLIVLCKLFYFMLAAIQLMIIAGIVVGVTMTSIWLCWWMATRGVPMLLRTMMRLPMSTLRPLSSFTQRVSAVVFIAWVVFGGIGLTVLHLQMRERAYPIFAKFKESAGCNDYSVPYDSNTLVERDRLVEQSGFVRLPWTGWWKYCDSAFGTPWTWGSDGISNSAVYLRVPWR